MKIHHIKPFCDVTVNVVLSRKEYNKDIKSKSSDKSLLAEKCDQGRATWLQSNKNGSPYFIIGIFIDDISIVAHEASHTVTHIMSYLNIKDDEFRGYMVGYITEKICDFLKEGIK